MSSMSFYRLRVPDRLVGFIRGLHPDIKRKIRGSLSMIVTDPNSGKPLKDELEGLRSFRVSRFRIVYRIAEPKEIQIVAIGPRNRIYEETYRIIKKESKG
jgi:mRNA interferase RelE/StbE